MHVCASTLEGWLSGGRRPTPTASDVCDRSACQRHQSLIMEGEARAAFYLGDGAGVGKGKSTRFPSLPTPPLSTSPEVVSKNQ